MTSSSAFLPTVQIDVYREEDWDDEFTLKRADGSAIDLTGKVLELFIRPTLDHATPILVMSTENGGIVVTDAAAGKAALRRDHSNMIEVPIGAWEQILRLKTPAETMSGYAIESVWRGPILVHPGRAAHAFEFDADALAWFAACSVEPSMERKVIVNDLVLRLKDAGLWAKAAWLLPLAGHAAPDIYRNLKNPAESGTPNGGLTVTADRGVAGNGTSGFIELPAPSAMAGVGLDNFALYLAVRTPGTGANIVVGSSATTTFLMNPKTATGNFQTRLNDATNENVANAGTRAGRWLTSRRASTVYARYRDGVFLGNATVTSTAVSALPVYLLRNGATYSDDEISFFGAFAGLNPAEVFSLDAAIAAYLAAIGAL